MRIHSVESLAALDGEGVRYALFLSGCPLNCVYCHNPDTRMSENGTSRDINELFNKIKRYKPYFASGGGVTFTGGEPLLQAKEIVALGKLLATEDIGYALDTSGNVPLDDAVKAAAHGAELVLLDLKFFDADDYKKYIGGDISRFYDFFDYLLSIKKRVWVRTVIVPGINDNEQFLDGCADAVCRYLPIVEKYQLLGFHTLGFFKYKKLGIPNPLENTPPLPSERLGQLQRYLDKKLKLEG